ncbi:MAG TPA: NAD-dependent protein deacetylase [Marmoricola sp.]|nr:NAD-dependent protein deacetylase [Marmoricola sp.]
MTLTARPSGLLDVLGDRRWLVLTGAGVSTDSGIPDYRGPGAVRRNPMTIQQFRSGPAEQQRYWARAYLGWSRMSIAAPNATHRILADLERRGRVGAVITQNVDGLHTRAGQRRVVDLHGRLDQVACLACGALAPRAEVQRRLAALNPGYDDRPLATLPDGDVALEETSDFVVATCACGGQLKPDVVFFGENVPSDRVGDCAGLVEEAEALVVLGSSLHVFSGRRWVKAAHRRGIPIVIVNRGETRGDELATVKVDGGCAETLAALCW